MNSILDKLYDWTSKEPDKLLYNFLDIDGNLTESYTYQEFVDRTTTIAYHLHQNYKFKKGDRILLAYPPGIELICSFFACVRLGLIPVPVYPPASHGFQSALEKTTYIAKDCGAKAVLTSRSYYWSIKLNLARNSLSKFSLKRSYISNLKWISTDDFRASQNESFPEDYTEILFLQYTSGSTSHPKGVMVSHENILHNGDVVVDHIPIGVSWLPQYHDMGLIGYYLFFAMLGGTTYGFSPMDFIKRPALWLESINKYKATASSAPNFAYEYCLRPEKIPQETYENLDLSSLQFLMTAAEPVRPKTYLRFLKKFQAYGLEPEAYFAAYGLAENTLAVSNYGRNILTVDKNSLKRNILKIMPEAAGNGRDATTYLMSCGKPLDGNYVKIVDPENHHALHEGKIGEIWIDGDSKCLGYWKKPEMTQKQFYAPIKNEPNNPRTYMRTGDRGFLHQGEVYICGREKDMIIVRGLNYYPQDIEQVVEESASNIRKGCVAAFEITEANSDEEKLVVVAEVKNVKKIPDPAEIAMKVRKRINIQPHAIVFIPPRTIPKTSSGKIARNQSRMNYLEGKFTVLEHFTGVTEDEFSVELINPESPFRMLKDQYGLTGTESFSLVDAGLDSLAIVELVSDLKDVLQHKGADSLAKEIDIRLIQKISISELFELANQLEQSSADAIHRLRRMLKELQKENWELEKRLMREDVHLTFTPQKLEYPKDQPEENILLTGGTGFFGPFILKSLLEQTDSNLYVLVRAMNVPHAKERLRAGLESLGSLSPELMKNFHDRVIPVCGDLGKARLGLDADTWNFLAKHIHTIYNNGAIVNYLLNYEKMRDVNVVGTNEILKLAMDTQPKIFNHISTTFIFGWSTKDTLFESDTNQDMELLDFGYSQTKWVSEQIVKDAMKQGLRGRIFRPALISPSVHGGGYNYDISIRLIAFMINHGMSVGAQNQVSFTPADIAANNIVAISNIPDSMNKTFHVTRDTYANMIDITNIITELTGQEFVEYPLKKFVPAVIDCCTKDDLIYPLLDFFTRSVDNISAMEFKLYNNDNYKNFRAQSEYAIQDPPLEEVVRGIVIFMKKNGIIQRELISTRSV